MLRFATNVDAVALFVNWHPRTIPALMVALAVGVIGLAVLGAVTLLMQPSLPKVLFGAAVAIRL